MAWFEKRQASVGCEFFSVEISDFQNFKFFLIFNFFIFLNLKIF